jgi:flavin reductase (DIM6/NTAB) family NADH-FMN oxidoreductase RutF
MAMAFVEPIASHSFAPETLSHAERYRMLTGTVIPRPIAFVTTLGLGGVVNAAPFSQFVIIAVDPPLLGFVVGERDTGPKDTLVNALREKEFVINTVPEDMAAAVQLCAEDVPPEISEPEMAGLSLAASTIIRTPRLAAAKVQFECRLHQRITFGRRTATLVVGEVVLVHHAAGLIQRDGKVDPDAYAPLGRIAGRNYCRLSDRFSV